VPLSCEPRDHVTAIWNFHHARGSACNVVLCREASEIPNLHLAHLVCIHAEMCSATVTHHQFARRNGMVPVGLSLFERRSPGAARANTWAVGVIAIGCAGRRHRPNRNGRHRVSAFRKERARIRFTDATLSARPFKVRQLKLTEAANGISLTQVEQIHRVGLRLRVPQP
jgi:hypothetical protein